MCWYVLCWKPIYLRFLFLFFETGSLVSQPARAGVVKFRRDTKLSIWKTKDNFVKIPKSLISLFFIILLSFYSFSFFFLQIDSSLNSILNGRWSSSSFVCTFQKQIFVFCEWIFICKLLRCILKPILWEKYGDLRIEFDHNILHVSELRNNLK